MVDMIEPSLAEKVWPHVWPLIESAVILETPDDILADLKAEHRFLLIVGDGVAIVRPCAPSFFEICYVGGQKAKQWWPQMSRAIDVMAKAANCQKVVAFGRNGWKRLAPDYTATETRMYIKDVA